MTGTGEEFDRAFWEERYHGHGGHGGGRPNPQLVAEVAELPPGTALDAGCGAGADAIWLAARGWRVTAVDIAEAALDRARRHAADAGEEVAGRIEWVRADLTDWAPPERFDLVTTHYVHAAGSQDELVRTLAGLVAPGGTLLVVGHHHGDPSIASTHFTADEVAAVLDPDVWTVAVAESRTRPAPAGHGGTMHDTVLRGHRRPV
ncbi:methyltransferase [Prauserella coralliicola]|nr:methyltransferase [Prauserella coralliicola]